MTTTTHTWKKARKRPVEIEYREVTREETIKTREGELKAYPGDILIRGVEGEEYPCDRAIFDKTYHPSPDKPEEKFVAWSDLDDEYYAVGSTHEEALDDLAEHISDMHEAGRHDATCFTAEVYASRRIEVEDGVPDPQWLAEDVDERMCDESGATSPLVKLRSPSPEAEDDLKQVVSSWVHRHCDVRSWYQAQETVAKYDVTFEFFEGTHIHKWEVEKKT